MHGAIVDDQLSAAMLRTLLDRALIGACPIYESLPNSVDRRHSSSVISGTRQFRPFGAQSLAILGRPRLARYLRSSTDGCQIIPLRVSVTVPLHCLGMCLAYHSRVAQTQDRLDRSLDAQLPTVWSRRRGSLRRSLDRSDNTALASASARSRLGLAAALCRSSHPLNSAVVRRIVAATVSFCGMTDPSRLGASRRVGMYYDPRRNDQRLSQ